MAVQVSYPGVYIEEFTPAAPIQGVGTSTAGFVGVTSLGSINEPLKVNSWDEFKQQFGDQPIPGFYLWYAVQGFYLNGGQTCYVVRASNGAYQRMTLNDRTAPPGRPVVTLRARQPGALGLAVAVAADAYLANVEVYRPIATTNGAGIGDMSVATQAAGPITADQVANRFKPGDEVVFSAGTDRRVIATVSGPTVRFTLPLSSVLPNNATMHLATTASGTRIFRLRPAGAGPLPAGQLVPGTILTFAQGGPADTQIVDSVISEVLTEGAQGGLAPFSYRVTLRNGLGIGLDLDPAQVNVPTASSNEIELSVGGGATYGRLSMDPSHPRYLIDIVNNDGGGALYATLVEPPPPNSVANSIPRIGAAQPLNPPEPGAAEDLSALTANTYTTALDTLHSVNDINFIAIPDRPTQAGQTMVPVQQALISQCELMADRFAVLDSDPGAPLFGAGSLDQQRSGLDSTRGYAALY